jgi:hypothetical protein
VVITAPCGPNPSSRPGTPHQAAYGLAVELDNPLSGSRTGSTTSTSTLELPEERYRMYTPALRRRASIHRRLHTCGRLVEGGVGSRFG